MKYAVLVLALAAAACSSDSTVTAPTPNGGTVITTDAALFTLVTETQPFSTYTRFPDLDTDADGILVASSAHQPLVRVSMNAIATAALQNGRLPAGATFPDGSVIFKEVLDNRRAVNLYAIMYKDRANPRAGNGWLWAEIRPSGDVNYTLRNGGSGCTGCHSLAQGPRNDSVRIFERQR